MLDVIGAGATATAAENWFEIWNNSPHAKALQNELERLHAEGRSRPKVEDAHDSEFSTSWMTQFGLLLRRDMLFRYRDPTYLIAKLALSIVGGLLIGVCFLLYRPSDVCSYFSF
jgi:ATP-binding cassette, subfamily G (WHITE), member 2, SNQ2